MAVNDNSSESAGLQMESLDSKKEVIDESHYSHGRCLRSVHDIREEVQTAKAALNEATLYDKTTQHRARRYYRGEVERFIEEVLPLLKHDGLDFQHDYLEGVKIGTVRIEPPNDLVKFARSNIDRMPPGGSVPTPWQTEIYGLKTILELPSPITRQFSVAIHTGGSVETVSRTVQSEVSLRLLQSAFRATRQALEDADMGFLVGEGRPRNSLGSGERADPWSNDTLLPHEIRDAVENGDVSTEELQTLIESKDGG